MDRIITDNQMRNINSAIDDFDFEKVHKVMNFLNWKWRDRDDKMGIPSISRLVRAAISLCYDAFSSLNKSSTDSLLVASGGFEVRVFRNNEAIIISFVLESSDCDNQYFDE